MTDGDFFEQRFKDGRLVSVAYIETIQVSSVENADKIYLSEGLKKHYASKLKPK